jgi:hypothetical protein
MFQTAVTLHLAKVEAQTETRNDVATAVCAVGLVLDQLTPALALELSPEIGELCFTRGGKIRRDVTSLNVRLHEKQQFVTASMAVDVSQPSATLRHVRVTSVGITKRGEQPGEEVQRKAKKIAPTAESLRARINCLICPDESATRQFLLCNIGKTFVFGFEDEERELEFGPAPGADDDEADDAQPALDFKPGRRRRAAAKTDGPTNETITSALFTINVELAPKAMDALTVPQRVELLDFVDRTHQARREGSDQPAPPSYLANPRELTAAGDVLDEQAAAAAAPPATAKATRARRRGEFANRPRLVGRKKR